MSTDGSFPKVSIVTISCNQVLFLEQALRSVLDQTYPNVEYIVVDPGSTDGSRAIIQRYSHRIDRVLLDPDEGPADGLNKGFRLATGDIYGFLNSDDFLLPGALARVVEAFRRRPSIDVISGHALVVDENGAVTNRLYSRRFSLERFVYGAATLAQQSTFFRASAFSRTDGFNSSNRVAWDGELWVDLALSGAVFSRINAFLSAYRLYPQSITGSARMQHALMLYQARLFRKVKGRDKTSTDDLRRWVMKAVEYGQDPGMLLRRIINGPVVQRCL